MSIKPHLMDDEEVLAHCTTSRWAWVCTSQRVLRYRSGQGSAEELHDLSFEEISAISMVNTGRRDELGGYAAISGIIGLLISLWAMSAGNWGAMILGIPLLAVAGYMYKLWLNSEEAYFEFRGSGMLQSEDEDWRIDPTSADDPSEVQEFVKKVRSQL